MNTATRRDIRARILRRLDPDQAAELAHAPLARLVEALLDQVDRETFAATFHPVELPSAGGEA